MQDTDGDWSVWSCGTLSRTPDGPEWACLKFQICHRSGDPCLALPLLFRISRFEALNLKSSVHASRGLQRCTSASSLSASLRQRNHLVIHIVAPLLRHVLLRFRFDLEACKRRDTKQRITKSTLHRISFLFKFLCLYDLGSLTVIPHHMSGIWILFLPSRSSSVSGSDREPIVMRVASVP